MVRPFQQNIFHIDDKVLLRVFPYRRKTGELVFKIECERQMPDGTLQFTEVPEQRWRYYDASAVLEIAIADSIYLQPSPSAIRLARPLAEESLSNQL